MHEEYLYCWCGKDPLGVIEYLHKRVCVSGWASCLMYVSIKTRDRLHDCSYCVVIYWKLIYFATRKILFRRNNAIGRQIAVNGGLGTGRWSVPHRIIPRLAHRGLTV